MFNDPSNKYQNDCVIPDTLDDMGMFVPAAAGMGSVAKKCMIINPTLAGRPLRDGTEIRNVCFLKFSQSGNQDGEHIYDEWVKFLDNSGTALPLIAYYAICIFTYHDFNLMGKSLPTEHQMDTGAINHEEVESQKVLFLEQKRKEQADAKSVSVQQSARVQLLTW